MFALKETAIAQTTEGDRRPPQGKTGGDRDIEMRSLDLEDRDRARHELSDAQA
jgi:hypothetical protein